MLENPEEAWRLTWVTSSEGSAKKEASKNTTESVLLKSLESNLSCWLKILPSAALNLELRSSLHRDDESEYVSYVPSVSTNILKPQLNTNTKGKLLFSNSLRKWLLSIAAISPLIMSDKAHVIMLLFFCPHHTVFSALSTLESSVFLYEI